VRSKPRSGVLHHARHAVEPGRARNDGAVFQLLQPAHSGDVALKAFHLRGQRGDGGRQAIGGHVAGLHVRVQQLDLALEDGERRAQVVRERGVQALALLGRAPQRALRFGQRGAHGFERRS